MKNFAIIGFGGLGKTHFLNLLKIEKERKDIRLAAICNADIESITKSIKINRATWFDFTIIARFVYKI